MFFDARQYTYALVTSTTYGTWLPGDERGFIDDEVERSVTSGQRISRFFVNAMSHFYQPVFLPARKLRFAPLAAH